MRCSRHGTRRPDQRAVGQAGAAAACGQAARSAVAVEQAAAHRRHPVAGSRRCAVARRASVLRLLASRVRAVSTLAAGRGLAADRHQSAGPRRRGGVDHLGCQRRLHHRSGPPTRCWRTSRCPQQQAEALGRGGDEEPADHALRRSHSGSTTKLHLACRQAGKPLSMLLTAGHHSDSPQFAAVLAGIRVPRLGIGRARVRDRTGSSPTVSTPPAPTAPTCAVVGSRPASPARPTRTRTAVPKAPQGGRPPPSTPRSTGSATPSSAASTASTPAGAWPPDTTSWPSATKPPSTSPPSTSGCNL